MNFTRLLITPSRSSHCALRWWTACIFMLCFIGALALAVFASMHNRILFSAMLLGLGLGYSWAFFMSNTLLLALDARQLRLPGIQREIIASLLLYGALSVLVPTLLYGLCGGDIPTVGTLLTLCVLGGLLFAVLPRYISMMMCFLPTLHASLRHVVTIPGPDDPRFLLWGMPVAVALLLMIALRWRQLLYTEKPLEQGFSGTLVMRPRRWNAASNSGSINPTHSNLMIRNRPDWMQPKVDMRKVGLQSPVNTLRVALGGWYLPKTPSGQLRAAAPLLLPAVPITIIMMIMQIGDVHGNAMRIAWNTTGIFMITWLGVFGIAMLTLINAIALLQCWRKVNAELPLLALLPGLGDAAAAKRELLRAALIMPLRGQTLLVLILLATAFAMHIDGMAILFIVLSQLGCAALLIAFVLSIFGGRPLPTWCVSVVMSIAFTLITLCATMPMNIIGEHPWVLVSPVIAGLGITWVLLIVVLLWLGHRGWRGLQLRPHAFLPN